MKNLYRKTYVEIDLRNIEENVQKIIKKFNDYKYYFAVVKADSYGHNNLETVRAVLAGGCNYLAVATLEEALNIRKEINDVPVLCLGVIPSEFISICKEKNITITINSLDYLTELLETLKTSEMQSEGLKAHLKVNTGMNRLGIATKKELTEAYDKAKEVGINIEGIYTHIYDAGKEEIYQEQIKRFENTISEIDLKEIPIIHVSASEALVNYEKPEYINGARLGIIMYGFTNDKNLKLKSTFSLYSEVIQINGLKKGDTVGYNGAYKASEDEKIAVIPIGYADGIIRKNTGRDVFINGNRYPIVGNICMDMLFVKIDESVKLHDKVNILKDIEHIEEVANYLDTIPYEVLCSIGKRVLRNYK